MCILNTRIAALIVLLLSAIINCGNDSSDQSTLQSLPSAERPDCLVDVRGKSRPAGYPHFVELDNPGSRFVRLAKGEIIGKYWPPSFTLPSDYRIYKHPENGLIIYAFGPKVIRVGLSELRNLCVNGQNLESFSKARETFSQSGFLIGHVIKKAPGLVEASYYIGVTRVVLSEGSQSIFAARVEYKGDEDFDFYAE